MAHLVKCVICGKSFDRDSIQAVRHGARRYSHATCEPDNTDFVPLVVKKVEDKELTALKAYIAEKYKDKANWALINRQIKQYKKENDYSYSGMLKSLIYFFEVQHNGIEKSNGGIGIIPFVYKQTRDYYYSLWVAQQQNQDKVFENKEKEVVIKEPRKKGLFKKFFSLGDEDE